MDLLALLIVICAAAIEAGANSRARIKNCDAIMVLGAAVHGNRPSRVLQSRLDTAYQYWESNRDCVIVVSGGKGKEELVTEASAMRPGIYWTERTGRKCFGRGKTSAHWQILNFPAATGRTFSNGFNAVFGLPLSYTEPGLPQGSDGYEAISAPFSYWLTLELLSLEGGRSCTSTGCSEWYENAAPEERARHLSGYYLITAFSANDVSTMAS